MNEVSTKILDNHGLVAKGLAMTGTKSKNMSIMMSFVNPRIPVLPAGLICRSLSKLLLTAKTVSIIGLPSLANHVNRFRLGRT